MSKELQAVRDREIEEVRRLEGLQVVVVSSSVDPLTRQLVHVLGFAEQGAMRPRFRLPLVQLGHVRALIDSEQQTGYYPPISADLVHEIGATLCMHAGELESIITKEKHALLMYLLGCAWRDTVGLAPSLRPFWNVEGCGSPSDGAAPSAPAAGAVPPEARATERLRRHEPLRSVDMIATVENHTPFQIDWDLSARGPVLGERVDHVVLSLRSVSMREEHRVQLGEELELAQAALAELERVPEFSAFCGTMGTLLSRLKELKDLAMGSALQGSTPVELQSVPVPSGGLL